MSESNKNTDWEWPVFDEYGMTQWHWRVLYPERLLFRNNVSIGSFTMIDATMGVEIEDNVQIGFGCTILSYSSIDKKSRKVILKNNSCVGANSVIMPGVTIGANSIVGANSLVTREVPENEIWGGSPARFLKKRADSTIDEVSSDL
jgi:acetyltransferase-like isoleucine patch superfamily enzyme